MYGDGVTALYRCELARPEDVEGLEPDAGPVFCSGEIDGTVSVDGLDALRRVRARKDCRRWLVTPRCRRERALSGWWQLEVVA
jgi:hypothetical protein